MHPFNIVIGLLILFAAFGFVEWRWPSIQGQRRLRRGWITDVGYYLYATTIGKILVGFLIGVSVLVTARLLGIAISVDQLKGLTARDTFVTAQPLALQLLEFTVIADFIGYWTHRGFHEEPLWRVHAVHHSSTELDWLSSVRVHPVNDALSNLAVAAPLLLVGFDPAALAVYVPFLTFYAILLHANVGWTYGPLRYVIASPVFHRWHHSAAPESANKNFAGLFVFWDLIFGTIYLPNGVAPSGFGVAGNPVPENLFQQLTYPFRRQRDVRTPQLTT